MALADRDVLLGEWGWWGRCFLARMGMVGTLFLGVHNIEKDRKEGKAWISP
jgi:hypothetical protein